jgi:hypothetical protein
VNQAAVPTPALRTLHEKMAALAVDEHVFRVISLMPDLPVHLLHAACDPASTVLLAWPIYHGIALACTGTEHAASRILPFYAAAKAAREAGNTAGVEDGTTQQDPPAGAVHTDYDQPTVPKLRLPGWPRPAAATAGRRCSRSTRNATSPDTSRTWSRTPD